MFHSLTAFISDYTDLVHITVPGTSDGAYVNDGSFI